MCERLKFEQQAYDLGKKYIVGLDEAGRGPMAGPLVVGAVIFPQGYYNDKINDSKKLTEKKRADVDRLNVYQASKKGMIDAIDHLSIRPDYALTDAMPLGDVIEHQAIVKGDAKSLSIGAASILAKVTRDHIMNDYAKIYPEYGFEKHKGYPTKQHKEALKAYGVTPIHRRSFQPVIDVLNQQMSLFDDF